MKYLLLNPPNPEQKVLVPVDRPLFLRYYDGIFWICLGNIKLFNVIDREKHAIMDSITNGLGQCDIVSINLTNPPAKELFQWLSM